MGIVGPVVERPGVERPVVERPVVERPVVERPVVERPVVERPVVERPVVERPVVERHDKEAAVRVIAGAARGRRLVAPRGRDVRPTADRVREALFNVLAPHLDDAAVLDLYAGSGALGIEALSRGAARAVFVERDERALAAIRRNLAQTGLGDRATVRARDARAYCRAPPQADGPFGIVLCDPPYTEPLDAVTRLLAELAEMRALAPGAILVVERDRRDPAFTAGTPPVPPALAFERARTYGDTVLVHLRARPGEEAPP